MLTCANFIYRCQKIALGIPSGALDSRQNVRFPPVECSVISARSNSNGPIRVENETTLRAAVAVSSFTSLWGKPKRWILSQSFRSSRVFRPPKHTYLEWNLLGFMEPLFLLRFGQPRSQGLFPGLGAGREKTLASAGYVSTLHPEILGVIN